MTITNGYATLNEYKAWIAVRGLSGSVGIDNSDDTMIELLIEGASRHIDAKVGYGFYADSVDATRYYQARDSYSVNIDNLSAAPTSVSVDTDNTRTYTALAASEYDLVPDNALLDGLPYNQIKVSPTSTVFFPTQRKGIKVVGKFGFPSVPKDIKEACLMIAQNAYGMRSGQTSGGKVTVTAAGVVIRPEEVPAGVQEVINYYKKRTSP